MDRKSSENPQSDPQGVERVGDGKEVEVLKNPPTTAMTSSSDPSTSRHEGSEDEGESAFVPLPPLPEVPAEEEEEEEIQEEIEEEPEEIDETGEEEMEVQEPKELPIIDISKMEITSLEEARRIAEIILQVLEQDLYELRKQGKFPHRDHHLKDPIAEVNRRKKYLRQNYSKSSLISNLSTLEFILEEPSTLSLSYERIENEGRHPLQKLADKFKMNASTQVDLHRDKEKQMDDGFCQTKEFTMLRRETARTEFIKLYPKPDDWVKPSPALRDASLQNILDLANDYDPEQSVPIVGPKPKYKKPLQQRILKGRVGDYQKEESYWTGSSFKGDFKDKMFHLGHYDFPTMAKYESEFREGHIHSTKHFGQITYPRGDKFEGTWRKGRFTDGKITFGHGLKFEPMGWRYCTPPDRRFFIEKTYGVQGIGETWYTNESPPPRIPYECYDVGDGIYNPETRIVTNYRGIILRKVTEYEHRWIVLNCRKKKPLMECYEPLFMTERPPDLYANSYPKNAW